MNKNVFMSADILLPRTDSMEKWAVIACDQFTSDRKYWQRVRDFAAGSPSAVNLILPEAELGSPDEAERIAAINTAMDEYLAKGVFECFDNSYIYVERTLENGSIRKGLVGIVDLEAYDYCAGAVSDIRATERTVEERIPPRQKVRINAALELPHVLMLCDDEDRCLIEPVAAKRDSLRKLYDFELMEGGGRIQGYLVCREDAEAFDRALSAYSERTENKYSDIEGVPMTFAVGDGNHSLATAKSCYEKLKAEHPGEDMSRHPARYALVELENIHDEAQVFEPIHRVVFGTEPEKLLAALEDFCAPGGYPVEWYTGEESSTVYLDRRKSELAVGVLQSFLDDYLAENAGTVDYIHDDDALRELAGQKNAVGFLLPAMEKSQLFRGVIADGALPRKTFSMGHSREKRYYLEARKIR